MTPTTKETRRSDWKTLNFAGSIDWALDLQAFTTDDMATPPKIPAKGEEGCVAGEDKSVNSGDLCEFSCSLGFCPESLCTCTYTDIVNPLPNQKDATDVMYVQNCRPLFSASCNYSSQYLEPESL